MSGDKDAESNVKEFPGHGPSAAESEALTEGQGDQAQESTSTVSGSYAAPSYQTSTQSYYGTSEYYAKMREHEVFRRAQFQKKLALFFVVFLASCILLSVAYANRGVFVLDEETLIVVNKSVNAVVILIIPLLLGMVGAISRLLLSGVGVVAQLPLVIGSGAMAAFSWVGIKSGVLMAVIAPHLDSTKMPEPIRLTQTPSDFYTMALVAIFVGMFSTNLYIFINQKVDQLASERKRGEG